VAGEEAKIAGPKGGVKGGLGKTHNQEDEIRNGD